MFEFQISRLKDLSPKYETAREFVIRRCVTLDALQDESLIFVKKPASEELLSRLKQLKNCLIILLPGETSDAYDEIKRENMVIESPKPRLDFARIFQFILDNSEKTRGEPFIPKSGFQCGKNVIIGYGTIIDENVRIDNNVVIGDNVHIGKNCRIMSGVIINDNVVIGERCVIREQSVIGGWGFGFERDDEGIPIRLPHVGGVRIGHDVEIGAFNTIVGGTFKPTTIGDYTKSDDHVHVAHNCRIGSACMLTANVTFSGSTTVGDRCWLGVNASTIQGTVIGNDCFIGMGSVVKKNVPDGVTVSNNPAQTLEELALQRRIFNKLKKQFKDAL